MLLIAVNPEPDNVFTVLSLLGKRFLTGALENSKRQVYVSGICLFPSFKYPSDRTRTVTIILIIPLNKVNKKIVYVRLIWAVKGWYAG